MNLLAIGKLLETIGAVGLAYVGVRAAYLEISVGRHLHLGTGAEALDELRDGLEKARQFRQHQFGPKEVAIVGAGTALVALGCGLYLYGMLTAVGGH
jgi:hypothetical protein